MLDVLCLHVVLDVGLAQLEEAADVAGPAALLLGHHGLDGAF